MRLATGSEQRWSPRCWGGRCQGARFDSVALLRYAIRAQGQRMITRMLCWSDGDGKVIEGDPEPVAGGDAGGDVVVAAAQVLREGVTGGEGPG